MSSEIALLIWVIINIFFGGLILGISAFVFSLLY